MNEVKKLFLPGPTSVHPSVLEKMSTPPFGHRTQEASNLQRSITQKLQTLLYTKNKMILSTSSGTGLLEGAIRSATAKRAIVFSVGDFGNRWHKLALLNGIPADIHQSESGSPTLPETVKKYLSTGKYDVATITHSETSTGIMNPLELYKNIFANHSDVLWLVDGVSSVGGIKTEIDKLGVDVCITSSQKALALPPGLSIACVSEKAQNRFNEIGSRGYYFDFKSLLDYIDKRNHQYSSTPSTAHMVALDYQLDRILSEGIEKRWDRHLEMAEYTIEWANKYMAMHAMPGFESLTVSCIKNTMGLNVEALNMFLLKKGMLISNGYGELQDKTIRIGHMGEHTLADITELLGYIEEFIQNNKR